MAKICPETSVSSSSYMTSTRETFTLWMKSLVFHGNGCTVFNSKGQIAFRIDNYQQRCCSDVYLMDPFGQVLFSIQKQKLGFIGGWKIYKWSKASYNREGLWFQVRKNFKVTGSGTTCNVSVGWDRRTKRSCYRIIQLNEKSALKIIDSTGQLVAQVKRKQSASGVPLGDDVLSLVVEPNKDYALIMALVTVHGLIKSKL